MNWRDLFWKVVGPPPPWPLKEFKMFVPNPTTLTIPNGAQASNELNLVGSMSRGVIAMEILAPLTLPETVSLQSSIASGGNFRTLQSGGVDITIAAGKVLQLTEVTSMILRLASATPVGADRVFDVVGNNRA